MWHCTPPADSRECMAPTLLFEHPHTHLLRPSPALRSLTVTDSGNSGPEGSEQQHRQQQHGGRHRRTNKHGGSGDSERDDALELLQQLGSPARAAAACAARLTQQQVRRRQQQQLDAFSAPDGEGRRVTA